MNYNEYKKKNNSKIKGTAFTFLFMQKRQCPTFKQHSVH